MLFPIGKLRVVHANDRVLQADGAWADIHNPGKLLETITCRHAYIYVLLYIETGRSGDSAYRPRLDVPGVCRP